MVKKASKAAAKPRAAGPSAAGAEERPSPPASGKMPVSSPAKANAKAGRGTAPWVSRHARKQAEEARTRANEPLRPGSARATLREPEGADEIKARISALHESVQRVRTLKKRLNDSFFEIGETLVSVQERKLYEAKGYASLEAFAERELDLGKNTASKLTRIVRLFQPSAAAEHGYEALMAALDALDEAKAPRAAAPRPLKPPARS